MAEFSYQQVAATLASGILAGSEYDWKSLNLDDGVEVAVDIYKECLKQLRQIPEGDTGSILQSI